VRDHLGDDLGRPARLRHDGSAKGEVRASRERHLIRPAGIPHELRLATYEPTAVGQPPELAGLVLEVIEYRGRLGKRTSA
jgi:hypothetical protein